MKKRTSPCLVHLAHQADQATTLLDKVVVCVQAAWEVGHSNIHVALTVLAVITAARTAAMVVILGLVVVIAAKAAAQW